MYIILLTYLYEYALCVSGLAKKDGKLVYFSICVTVKKVNCILFLLLTYIFLQPVTDSVIFMYIFSVIFKKNLHFNGTKMNFSLFTFKTFNYVHALNLLVAVMCCTSFTDPYCFDYE